MTGFVSANAGLIAVLAGVGLALNKISKETVNYANEVRGLSQISKISTEDASRTLQVLDDYKITYDDLTLSARALKEKGLTPTVDTLAKLAEQYQAIQDPAKQLNFIQDNLGRNTTKWQEILGKSPDLLRKQAAGINENLILSQKQVDAARRLEIAEDAKNDALQAVSITLGNKLIPVQTEFLNGINVLIRGLEIAKERHIGLGEATDIAGQEIWQEQEAMLKMNDAANSAKTGVDELTNSQAENEETAKRLSAVYTGLLSSMFSIESANQSYAQTIDDLTKKDADLAAEKDRLTLAMWQEQQAGKLTNDENLRYVQQMAEITAAQEENAKAKEDAEKDAKKASEQRVYDLAQQKLAADGVVSSGEYEYLQNLAVSMGLVSRASADQAIAESNRADALVENFAQTLPPMERSLLLMQQMASYNGTMVNFGVNFQSNMPKTYNVPGASYNKPNPQAQPGGYGYQYGGSRDSGGSGIAGTAYMIGTGAQPELFTPSTNGTFTPANKMGATYNIVVNNPVKETAENSIRSALKKLSYVGVAA